VEVKRVKGEWEKRMGKGGRGDKKERRDTKKGGGC
jgi:hypothetical protein